MKYSRADIIFTGTAIIDAIIRGFDPEPVSATGYRADSCSLNIGGEAVNGAIAAAKLGARAAILCHLGNDAAGAMIEDELVRQGVDVSHIVHSDSHATPVTTMFVAGDGSRKSITNLAHKYNFHPELHMDSVAGAKALVLGSLFRAPFDDPCVIRAVAEFAHEHGMLVFADTKLPNFTRLSLDDIAEALPLIDYITPNEDEGRFCTGEDDPELMADALLAAGARNVVLKLGPKGCLFRNREASIRLPACNIDAVDATGAGDNFLAGFVTEILRGSSAGEAHDPAADSIREADDHAVDSAWGTHNIAEDSIREALVFANVCGAICTTAVGAGTALRSRGQVMTFIERQRIGII